MTLLEIEKLLALFYIYSIAGWIMETVSISIREKKFVDRGFLIGPYCPIYGTGVVLITVLLQKYNEDLIATFVMSIVICGILEYFTSYFMEKIFKARWWDYSTRKFNLNGRVCMQNLIIFGVLGTFILFVTNPFILTYLDKVPEMALQIVLGIVSVIFIIDTIVSYKVILGLKNISRELKDNTIEISDKVKKTIKSWRFGLYRRYVKAFPRIKDYVKYNKWDEIKKKLEESKEEIKEKIGESTREIKEKIKKPKEK